MNRQDQRTNVSVVVSIILDNEIPDGEPAEPGGAIEHLQKLQEFMNSDQIGLMTEPQVEMFSVYLREVAEKAALQQRELQVLQAAQAFGQGRNGGAPGRPPTAPTQIPGNPPVQNGELLDETLPGAGGGANTGEI